MDFDNFSQKRNFVMTNEFINKILQYIPYAGKNKSLPNINLSQL